MSSTWQHSNSPAATNAQLGSRWLWGHIPVSREGKFSTASPKPWAVLSCAKMGLGQPLAWQEATLLMHCKQGCKWSRRHEESMEGQAWTGCSRLEEETPSFPVSVCAASQQSSQNSSSKVGCKPWGRSQQGQVTCL